MRYREMLLRFIAGDEMTGMEVVKLERANYIKMKDEIQGFDTWLNLQKNYEVTELGLKKLGGSDEENKTK